MTSPPPSGSVAVVVIGRNEGARLDACLASLRGQGLRIVYVDSGSHDGSPDRARAAGALVVELDRSAPFTAARGRNAGVAALSSEGLPDYIQFFDGDCTVVPGWIDAARATLDADADLGLVTGWRSEIHRDASVYNQMCEVEWHRPAGPIRSCGGDMMVRRTGFEAVGGFNTRIIASEDEEFCLRLRAAGYRLVRLPLSMTRHDAAILHFRQWWQRNVRSGHGFAEVGGMHPEHFVKERHRVWLYGMALPLLLLGAMVLAVEIEIALILALFGFSWLRTARGLRREGVPAAAARHYAAYYTLAKLPQLQGMLFYYWRRARGQTAELIEYK